MWEKTDILIILLGGKSIRFNESLPKQFLPFREGQVLFEYTTGKLLRNMAFQKVVFSVFSDYIKLPVFTQAFHRLQNEFAITFSICEGGESRHHSFINAIELLSQDPDDSVLCIHDANRPHLTKSFLQRADQVKNTIDQTIPCAIPVIPATDSLCLQENGMVTEYIDREACGLVQTPQFLHLGSLKEALKSIHSRNFTDEGSLMIQMGFRVITYEGDRENKKITFREDLL